MDTTILQKRIEDRAKRKEEEDFTKFLQAFNWYLWDLRIVVWDQDFNLKYFLCNENDYKGKVTTNLSELRERRARTYEVTETDAILDKVKILADFLENPPQY